MSIIDPVFIEFGFVTIRWYGVMMALGFIAALVNWSLLGKKEGKDVTFCSDLLFWIMISGILGARLAYVISNPGIFLEDPLSIVRLDQGGLIFYGGFIGALCVVFVFAKMRRENPASLYDFASTSVPLSHAFGRVGCFLNGCCYGKDLSGGNPFPVQLLESVLNIVLYVSLLYVYRRKERNGVVAASYLIGYSIIRFNMEFLRGDPRMRLSSLSIAQLVSIALLLAGLSLLIVSNRKPAASK